MKRIFFFLTIVSIMATGCKCHKNNVVSAQPEFNAEEVWQLTALQGKEAVYQEGQRKVSIQINTEAGTFSGNNGCNKYFGTFKDLGNGKMALSNFNATKMACPEAFSKMERSYMQLLERCDGYSLGEYSLDLLQGDKVLLSFEKAEN